MSKQPSPITGREPHLSTGQQTGSLWKISPRRLATMLNTLPPNAISLPAAAEALHHEKFDVLRTALQDPAAREAAIWPLAWLRDEAAAKLLHDTYYETQHLSFKAHILRVSVSLMSELSTEFLDHAMQHPDADFRQFAEAIAARIGSEGSVTYDTEAPAGRGFRNPVLGR
jgi:uncharacterized membrane protein